MDNNFNFNRITLDILTSAEEIPSPVEISDAYFETNEDTGSIIKITVRRDLSIPIESVTVAFCIDPVNFPEGKRRRVNEVVCNNAALNTREFLTISIKITGNIRINGGCVFLTAVAYDSDMAIKFTPCGLERYVIGDVYDTIPSAIGNSSASSDPVDDLDSYAPPEDIIKPKKNRIKRTVIAVTSSVLIVSSAIVGGLLIWRGQGVEKIADELIAENRYNEAYKIVSDTIYSGVLQKVCEEASVYYASQGDYCTAYVYSKAAPSSYDFYVTEVAKEELLSSVSGNTINQNALAVIRQITDTEKYDSVIASLAEMCRSNRKYDTAMSFAGEISSVEKRNNMTAEIFTDGIKYYTENGQFELIGGLIEAFGYHEDVAGKLTEYCSSIGISFTTDRTSW